MQQWNDTRRRFKNKGFLSERDTSPDKGICYNHPFGALMDGEQDKQAKLDTNSLLKDGESVEK